MEQLEEIKPKRKPIVRRKRIRPLDVKSRRFVSGDPFQIIGAIDTNRYFYKHSIAADTFGFLSFRGWICDVRTPDLILIFVKHVRKDFIICSNWILDQQVTIRVPIGKLSFEPLTDTDDDQ